MLVCPKENFNKETIVFETMDGHQCAISMDDVKRTNFCDMYDYVTIHLHPESRVAQLLETSTVRTLDKREFSKFYLGYDVTEPMNITPEEAEWCADWVDQVLYKKRFGKTRPHPLPPFPK